MKYSIRELSELAGVSARTLRYYDQIGLLKPLYTNEAGYRYYGEKEVALLQQILFYRARGFDLKRIQQIVYHHNFDIMQALEEHLLELEEQRLHTEALIQTVKQTILSMKGEFIMSDKEKFDVFKEKAVKENEDKYGAEVREKYGSGQMDASNQKLLDMSEKEWEQFKSMENEIYESLKAGVLAGIKPDSEEAGRIVALHKKWLSMTWKQYSPASHKGVAAMYTADDRFTQYYDKEVSGCAKLLQQAVECWADKI
ncbi:MAG: MerR family transcriptional regulator [Eubacteriales bacterium]|nr:MerR family transcriptional regulator [Eubacteriales bacterium]